MTATTSPPQNVVIEEPERRANVRHASDLLRLVIALLVAVGGFLLATTLNNISEAITVEVIESVDAVPNGWVVLLIASLELLSLLLPVLAVAALAWLRQWRRLGLALLAALLSMGAIWAIEAELVSRFSPPDLPFVPPDWICKDLATSLGRTCVVTSGGWPTVLYMAGGVAFFAALAPWMNRAWRRFAWIAIGVLVFLRMIDSLTPPTDELLVIGLAYAIGAGVLLLFGMPDRRPRGVAVVQAMARSGIELAELKRAGVDARGSMPWFGTTQDGKRLFIKVLSPEERAGDILFRVFRMFRLKGVGDERPFSSLKRAVEHEAVVALKARADGVKTPLLEAVVDVPPNSMLLAYEAIEGASLDGVNADDLNEDVLRGGWDQVGVLRSRRTAHRDLRLANVFLGADRTPWLIDFGFAELAATDGQLRSDVAELVVSTAAKVGPEKAVTAAVAGIGSNAVADAAPRIQPLALSGATRDSLKEQKGLDEDVRAEIQRQTGLEEIELEDLERIKSKTILMVIGFAAAIYFLIPQLANTDFGAVLDADWRWAPAVLMASFVTYVGAAWNIMGSVPDRIRLFPSVLAQFAGTFINRITPVKVGGIATNVRYLQKSGVDSAVAAAGIGISNVATMIVHTSLLVLFVIFVGRDAGDFVEVPSGSTVLIGLVAVFTLAGLVVFLPAGRKLFREKVWPVIRRAGQGLVQIASSPRDAMMLFGGAFVLIMSYIVALWMSLEAFGGGLGFFAVGVVFLAGQALGQAAPTPGGIGATEAAMIAAMTTFGLDSTIAVPTVFLYRIATFWLPILPGVYALRKLEAEGAL